MDEGGNSVLSPPEADRKRTDSLGYSGSTVHHPFKSKANLILEGQEFYLTVIKPLLSELAVHLLLGHG